MKKSLLCDVLGISHRRLFLFLQIRDALCAHKEIGCCRGRSPARVCFNTHFFYIGVCIIVRIHPHFRLAYDIGISKNEKKG